MLQICLTLLDWMFLYAPAWKNNTHTWFDCKLANAIMGLCSSCSQSLCKRHSRRFPSPLTPLLPVPSHIPSFFLHLSFLPVPHSLSSNLFVVFGCSSWLQSWARESHPRVPLPPDECRQRQKARAACRNTAPFLPALPCASAEERVTYRTGTSRLIVKGKKHTHTEWGLAGLTSCVSLSTKIPGSRAEAKRGRARACFFPVCVSLRVCFSTCHGLCFLSRLAETGHGCPGLED